MDINFEMCDYNISKILRIINNCTKLMAVS